MNRKDEGNEQNEESLDPHSFTEESGDETLVVKSSPDVRMPKAVSPPTSGPEHPVLARLEPPEEKRSGGKFEGLDILVKEDGVYLVFESKEGKAMISLSAIADGRGKTTGGVMRAWCKEARERDESFVDTRNSAS